ncbi:MAG: hypothetical protein AB9869_23665 [Verrucomicrobiia bacterium]
MLKNRKPFVFPWSGLLPGLITPLLAAGALRADTPYTGTGQILATPVQGLVVTNTSGQVLVRGQVQTLRVDSSDPRLTTRRTVLGDGFYQVDGSIWVYGTAYLEVGSWAEANFTPSGGVWEANWQGVMRPDASVQFSLAGYGSGGAIDGLRLVETSTRGPGATAATVHAGTIKPAPVTTTQVVDNFDDGKVTGWGWDGTGTYFPLLETNHQLTVRAKFPGLVTRQYGLDTSVWPGLESCDWSIANNHTLEARVDLISMSENATNYSGLIFWSSQFDGHSYILSKGVNFVEAAKYANGGVAVFFHDKAVIKNTNVVLSLLLTRVDPNMVITARVLDKDTDEAVLFQRSVVDTPAVDPTLTTQDFASFAMNPTVWSDSGPPLTAGTALLLFVGQYTDGNHPELDVTYDNLELRTSEIPPVTIERAVRLSWPASTTINYTPQAAPAVQGPWKPVQDWTTPGLNQITVPADEFKIEVFRLQQAP